MKKRTTKPTPSRPQPVSTVDGKMAVRLLPWAAALLAFLIYANTLGHGFTVDDDTVISKNKYTVQGISALPEIFSTPYRAGFHDRKEGLYRPLPVAVFATLHEVFGDQPFGYHLVNVIVYGITAAVLVKLLLILLFAYPLWVPAFISLLFTVHPLHTEVVANAKSLDELLALLFFLLALWASLHYLKSTKSASLAATGVCYFLSLLSKESAIAALVLLPLTWYYFHSPRRSQWMALAATLAAVTIGYLFLRQQALGGLVNFGKIEPINNSLAAADSYAERLATAIYILGIYLRLLFIPHPLSYDYSFNTIALRGFADSAVLLSLLALGFLGFLALRGWKRKTLLSYGIWFFAISLAPVANIILLIESTMAERFLYMPSLGFCIAATAALYSVCRRHPIRTHGFSAWLPPGRLRFILLIPALFALKTVWRNNDWKSNYTLLMRDVQTHPQSARIRYALGSVIIYEKALKENNARQREQWLREGIKHLQAGVSILPTYGDAWFNMGFAYNELGQYDAAVTSFERALEHTDSLSAARWVQVGIAYGESGRYNDAYRSFRAALAINDTSFDALNNLGMFYSRQGKNDSAIFFLQQALLLRPANSKALYNMGNVYAARAQYPQAIGYYRKALVEEPGFVDALTNLGNCYGVQGKYDSALVYYHQALALSPDNYNLRNNLSLTYRLKGDTAAAARYRPQP
ncbi:MAG: tetratricopeptide repeat protein [Chitinophagales bacterium]|nr:tetratricopeptide repeat protein [Chitinophagales bacterium]MDW8392716.1 tetratricopeptide repeat protein [Chitinophagales bacterium]